MLLSIRYEMVVLFIEKNVPIFIVTRDSIAENNSVKANMRESQANYDDKMTIM